MNFGDVQSYTFCGRSFADRIFIRFSAGTRICSILSRSRMVTVLFSAACRSNGGNVDTVAEGIDCSVNTACDAEKQYTGSAKQQRYSRVVVAAECGYRGVIALDVHGLDYEQIVVKRKMN